MASIHIIDLTTTELQELDLLNNDLKDLSNVEQNNVQGGIAPIVIAGMMGFAYGYVAGTIFGGGKLPV